MWPMKTVDPGYLVPKQFGRFRWFCLCLCLRRISFSLGSSLLLAFVLVSLVKTRLKGPGKRGHIVADTLLPMMFLGLHKLGNICCGHKMFLNKIRNIFCVRNKCCARGQTGKHLCRQQCVRNNVSSFARTCKQTTTAMATRMLPNKRFNGQDNSCARALKIFVHFFIYLTAPKILKAPANEDTLLRTHCCRRKCFPVYPRAQHLLRTQKMFVILFRNILCP